jgi:hypothetical protein
MWCVVHPPPHSHPHRGLQVLFLKCFNGVFELSKQRTDGQKGNKNLRKKRQEKGFPPSAAVQKGF